MKLLLGAVMFSLTLVPLMAVGESRFTGEVEAGAAFQVARLSVDGVSGMFTGFALEIAPSASLAAGTSSDLRLGVSYSYWNLTNSASAATVETLKGHVLTPHVSWSISSLYFGMGVRALMLDFSSSDASQSSNSTHFGLMPTAEAGLSLRLRDSGIVVLPVIRTSHGKLKRSGSSSGSTLTSYELSARIRFSF